MKQLSILAFIVFALAMASCNKKHNANRDLNCNENGAQCTKDSQFVKVVTSADQNCLQWDGVNVKNINSLKMGKVGDSIVIQLDAVAINSGANGNVLFASAQDDDVIEIKTYLQYNVCGSTAQYLNNVPCIYYFVPKKEGDYRLTFINVYGDRTRLSIQIKK